MSNLHRRLVLVALVAFAALATLRGATEEGFAGPWRKTTLTYYTSYPSRTSAEWDDYSGGKYLGMFAASPGMKFTKEWVARHNIVAVHGDDFPQFKGKLVRIRWRGKLIDAQVRDLCLDGDTSDDQGCSANKRWKGNGFLIDLEANTARRLGFVSTGMDSAEFQLIDANEPKAPWGTYLLGAERNYTARAGVDYKMVDRKR